ncbi:MAG TPA: 3'-5' exonuclease, partial [Candidatus Methylomirabilis sp.]|nr:3'-5' exonuclease [Candidatus Methylomirabilis sp.]
KGPEGLRADRVRGLSAVIFPGFRTYSAFRRVPGAGRPVTFEQWEKEKIEAEERRLLYVAATRAKDRLYMVDGGKGAGSSLRDALVGGLEGATAAGEGRCFVTGLPGERLRLLEGPAANGPFDGELLRVTVTAPLPELAPQAAARAAMPAIGGERPAEEAATVPAPPPAPPPVSLAELHDRSRGKRFGEKVHRIFEAFPPVTDPWPPPGATLPVIWDPEEERRWNAIVIAVRSSALHRELRSARVVGTELPLLRVCGGTVAEARADLVARAPGPAGELWVIDYKTGERDREQEKSYVLQVEEYVEILRAARNVPVRGFIWYIESGESI